MNTRTTLSLLRMLALAASVACSKTSSLEPTPTPRAVPEQTGHAGEATKTSDLDRPVAELSGSSCEHGKKTFECDECRYQVGFVRAPAALFEGGLLKATKAERQKVAAPIVLTGEVRFDDRRVAHVSSQVEGVIRKVHVALGDWVRAGQPLVEIDSVAVSEAQAAYHEAQAMLELARRNHQRQSELRAENISSEREYLEAKQEFEAAQVRATGALGKLKRLGAEGERGLVLRAPMDGSAFEVHGVPGELAKVEESLVTVGDNRSVWVWADLYERDIAAVQRARAAQKLAAFVSVKAYPGEEFPGSVSLVSQAMDQASRTVKVRVAVENGDGRLLAGMFATVKVFLPGDEEAIALPRDAVLEDEGRSFVFVHDHGEYYVRRPVEVGREWAGVVEIKKGLEPMQTVVADGAFLMKSDVLRSKMGAGCAD